ncbi:hypothetical protein, partial [Roseibacillus persicicus]|uniref:hypothetical protein n=1 Tax=Roseibacillus persicicus TaxID=454148 RepID=UPI00280F07A2
MNKALSPDFVKTSWRQQKPARLTHPPSESHLIIDTETNFDPIKPSGTNQRSQLGVHLKETSVPLPRQSRR